MGDYVCGNCIHYRGDGTEGFCWLNGGGITYYDCDACTAFAKEEEHV